MIDRLIPTALVAGGEVRGAREVEGLKANLRVGSRWLGAGFVSSEEVAFPVTPQVSSY